MPNLITYLSPILFMSFILHLNNQELKASSDNVVSELQFTKDRHVEGFAVVFFLNLQGKIAALVIGEVSAFPCLAFPKQ